MRPRMALTGCSAYGENLNSCSGQNANTVYCSVKRHTAQRGMAGGVEGTSVGVIPEQESDVCPKGAVLVHF